MRKALLNFFVFVLFFLLGFFCNFLSSQLRFDLYIDFYIVFLSCWVVFCGCNNAFIVSLFFFGLFKDVVLHDTLCISSICYILSALALRLMRLDLGKTFCFLPLITLYIFFKSLMYCLLNSSYYFFIDYKILIATFCTFVVLLMIFRYPLKKK